MKRKLGIIGIILSFLFVFSYAMPVHAACGCKINFIDGSSKKVLGYESIFFNNVDGCHCDDGHGSSILMMILSALALMISIVIPFSIIGILISGYQYMTARDNDEQIAKAKRRIFHIVVGLGAFSLLWALGNFFIPGGMLHFIDDVEVEDMVALSEDEVAELERENDHSSGGSNPGSRPTTPSNPGSMPNSSPTTTFTNMEYTAGNPVSLLLYTPSTAQAGKMPLIVYLHGSSGQCRGEGLKNIVGIKEFTNWSSNGLHGINAYVLFPQTTSCNSNWSVAGRNSRDIVWNKVVEMVNNGQVDPYRVSIMGQSSGSYGVQHFVSDHPDRFSAAVLLSGYKLNGFDISKAPPMKFIYGSNDSGPRGNVSYFRNQSNVEIVEYKGEGHDSAVGKALKDDADGDGKSDLMEWALSKRSKLPVE